MAGPKASKKKGAAESSDDDTNEMKKHVERTAHLLAKKHVSERPSITRTPLLKVPRSALKSGAKRVDSSIDDEDSMSPVVSVKAKKGKEAKSKSKKITKNDLAYMLSWDPTKKTPAKSSSKQSLKAGTLTPGIGRNGTVEMAKIEEEPNEDSASSGEVNGEGRRESNESAQSNDSDTKTLQVPQQKENEQITDDESKDVDVPAAAPPRSSVESAEPDVETAFTGLVKKSNMFHVNGKPYAKLGVIGRGGRRVCARSEATKR